MAIVAYSPPRALITGTGYSVPPSVVSNDYFAEYLETNDEWIVDRTGISQRRWVQAGVPASDLALPACQSALKNAGITPADLDGVIVATVTPDYVFPSTACVLQNKLGIPGGSSPSILTPCAADFVYALSVASALMAQGVYKHMLVVGVDMFSRLIDKNDRSTCILFGDGAGAVVLSRADLVPNSKGRGILSYELGADGTLGELLHVKLAPSGEPGGGSLGMNGREIFKLAVRSGVEAGVELCKAASITVSEIDFMVSHQANKRILAAVGRQLELPEGQVLMNVDRFGNTSAASIPLLLGESVEKGVVKPGNLLLLSAFGGGVTWGGMLVRF